MFTCVVFLLATSAFAQLDAPPQISITPFAAGFVEPGVLEISGISSDDIGIDRNRLYVKNLSTNKFWNGSAWVDNWLSLIHI